jgi:hypothetical protein
MSADALLAILGGALLLSTVDQHTPRWLRPVLYVGAGLMLGLAIGAASQ